MFYPDFHNLFTEFCTGRPLSYTPEQVATEFEKYMEEVKANPIEVTSTEEMSNPKWGKTTKKKKNTYFRSPSVSDFVTRWLGKQMDWWNRIGQSNEDAAFSNIKAFIIKYIRNIKLQGARIGIYNPVIVARELGLKEHIETNKSEEVLGVSLDEVLSAFSADLTPKNEREEERP